jgi:hypothetical protein
MSHNLRTKDLQVTSNEMEVVMERHVQARMRHERRLQNSRARTCADIFMFQRPRYCRKRGYGMLDCSAKGSDREGKGNEVEPGSLGINPPPEGEPPAKRIKPKG